MCDLDGDDFELPSIWQQRRVTARKVHECRACHGAIRPGETYVRHFSVHGRDVVSDKMCGACVAVSDRFLGEHGAVPVPRDLRSYLLECSDGDDEWSRAALAMEARGVAAREARDREVRRAQADREDREEREHELLRNQYGGV